MTAVLYHFHGLAGIDFSALTPEKLSDLQDAARRRDLEVVPTVYLRREALPRLCAVLEEFHQGSKQGEYGNILGFAIEGPVLGPKGGIPHASTWCPSGGEWDTIAKLGRKGLKYIVIAIDQYDLNDAINPSGTFADLLTRFYDNGVRIAPGHFHHDDPYRSAKRLGTVLSFLHDRYVSSPYLVLSDHLYNDMPRSFRHAWRSLSTSADRTGRAKELTRVTEPDWESHDLAELLGPVPAAMLQAAKDGLLMPCLNFDGLHVDLAVCRKTVDYLGQDRLIALTDHTDVAVMAGEALRRSGNLWLRDDGVVAAGTSGYESQVRNMLAIGLPNETIDALFYTNPRAAITFEVLSPAAKASGPPVS